MFRRHSMTNGSQRVGMHRSAQRSERCAILPLALGLRGRTQAQNRRRGFRFFGLLFKLFVHTFDIAPDCLKYAPNTPPYTWLNEQCSGLLLYWSSTQTVITSRSPTMITPMSTLPLAFFWTAASLIRPTFSVQHCERLSQALHYDQSDAPTGKPTTRVAMAPPF